MSRRSIRKRRHLETSDRSRVFYADTILIDGVAFSGAHSVTFTERRRASRERRAAAGIVVALEDDGSVWVDPTVTTSLEPLKERVRDRLLMSSGRDANPDVFGCSDYVPRRRDWWIT
jgi:hypothetical protein